MSSYLASWVASFLKPQQDATALRRVACDLPGDTPAAWKALLELGGSPPSSTRPLLVPSSSVALDVPSSSSPPQSHVAPDTNGSDGSSSSDDEDFKLALKLSLEEEETRKQRSLQRRYSLEQLEKRQVQNALRASPFDDASSYSMSHTQPITIRAPKATSGQPRQSPPHPSLVLRPQATNPSTSPTKQMEFQRQFVAAPADDEVHLVRHRRSRQQRATAQPQQQQQQQLQPQPLPQAAESRFTLKEYMAPN